MNNKVLIVAEHDGVTIDPSTKTCVQCARQIENAEIEIVVFAENGGALAAQAAKIAGVQKVLFIDNDVNKYALAVVIVPQIVALADSYSHVLAPSTSFGKDTMPRLAAVLGVNQVSDVMEVVGPYEFKRPVYAGNAIVSLTLPESDKVVATVRVASWRDPGLQDAAQVVKAEVVADIPSHTRFVKLDAGDSSRPALQTASTVVSGGRGLKSAENFKCLYELADTLGAAVGASRAAVDAGYVSNELQVGQTGKVISPDLYFAIGISGAIQHLTGIKDAGTIVAINKDEDAPIFEVADIGLVADLFEVVPSITSALSE